MEKARNKSVSANQKFGLRLPSWLKGSSLLLLPETLFRRNGGMWKPLLRKRVVPHCLSGGEEPAREVVLHGLSETTRQNKKSQFKRLLCQPRTQLMNDLTHTHPSLLFPSSPWTKTNISLTLYIWKWVLYWIKQRLKINCLSLGLFLLIVHRSIYLPGLQTIVLLNAPNQ